MQQSPGPIAKKLDQGAVPRSGSLPCNLVARFSRQMKPQRVYPLVVKLRRNKKPEEGPLGTLHLRPVIPGAIVTPTDYTLDLDHPETKPPFYITPLARGWLRNARLEIFQQGRLIGTIALPMKAVRQTLTWFLLFLTIAIPYSTYWLGRNTNFSRTAARVEATTLKDDEAPNQAEVPRPELGNEKGEKTEKNEEGRSEKTPGTFPKLPIAEGAVEHAMLRVLPDAPLSQKTAAAMQDVYEAVHVGPDYNLSFYLAAFLLGLTCISWAMHTTWSCRRRARPVH